MAVYGKQPLPEAIAYTFSFPISGRLWQQLRRSRDDPPALVYRPTNAFSKTIMSIAQTLRAQLVTKEQEVAAKQLELAALRKQVAAALTAEREEVISELLEKILAHNIGPEDLFPSSKIAPAAGPTASGPAVRKKGEPMYRDPATGATWTGRGKPPRWIAGKDKAQFLIVAQTVGPATGGANMLGEASTVAVSADNAVASAVAPADSSSASVDVAPADTAVASSPDVPAVNADALFSAPSTLATHDELTPSPARGSPNIEAAPDASSPTSGNAGEAALIVPAHLAPTTSEAVVEQ